MKARAIVLGVLVVLLAACTAAPGATPTPSVTASPSATATPSLSPTATPSATLQGADPDVAVVKIEQVGGMLPPWMTLQFYPTVALYGDGRLILPGPQLEMYPGPALPNLQVLHISEHGVQQVLDWAAEAGLEGEDRQLGEPLLDAGVTMFTVVRPEGTHRTSVTDMTRPDVSVRAAAQFQELMLNLRQWLADDIASDEAPYEWDRLRVISSPADPTVIADPELATELDWPLEDLATLGKSLSEPAQYRCFVVEGEDLTALRPMVEQANQLTLWNSGAEQYQLTFHPQLPDDEDCPGF